MNLTIHGRQGEVIAGTGDPPAQSAEREENINACRETMLKQYEYQHAKGTKEKMCPLSLNLSKVKSFQLFLSNNNEIDENEKDNV